MSCVLSRRKRARTHHQSSCLPHFLWTMELLHPRRFAMTELPAAKAFLKAEGYVVIRNVYTPEECNRFCAQLKASIEAICPAAAGVPLAELTAGHLPATDSNGLRGALAQSPAMWGIRQHAATQKLHRYLQDWSAEEELVVSLDKLVLQVGRAPRLGSWLHVDTSDPARTALQGSCLTFVMRRHLGWFSHFFIAYQIAVTIIEACLLALCFAYSSWLKTIFIP